MLSSPFTKATSRRCFRSYSTSMTNNPRKLVGLEGYGLEIVERIPLVTDPNLQNRAYLDAKRDKLGHLLTH